MQTLKAASRACNSAQGLLFPGREQPLPCPILRPILHDTMRFTIHFTMHPKTPNKLPHKLDLP